VIALAIAGAKAFVIILYFMHVRWGSGLTRLTVLGGLLWLGILVMGAMDDYLTRAWLPLPGK
jgi:cytochrome c oxidase subunit 4